MIEIAEGQKFFVEKMDGTPIALDEYRELEKQIETELGGPASAEYELHVDHWGLAPVSIRPVQLSASARGSDADFIEQTWLLKNLFEENNYIMYGSISYRKRLDVPVAWKGGIDAVIKNDYLQIRISKLSGDNGVTFWKGKFVMEPLDD
jgi:hypothetical protein